MIELRGITKRFGSMLAVRNLSFTGQDKEFIVVFGPAGAGKSTTLKMIAGVAQPNYGEICVNNELFNGVPPENRNISMVFENYALYSHLSVFENLAFPLRARKLPDKVVRDKVKKMGEMLHISEMLDRKPGFLSGGQRQRVALGRGLIRDADVYLLDEPISHLDARLRIQMRAELKRICMDKEANVIHVTHDYREAMALADKVIVMNNGRSMQQGTPEDVYHYPANEFVARFVGDPPMSFLNVSVDTKDGKAGFFIGEQRCYIPIAKEISEQQYGKIHAAAEIKLGFRANTSSIVSVQDAEHQIPAVIYLVEAQGHRNLITVKIGQEIVQVITLPDQNLKVGETVWIALSPEILHIFLDGEAIYHPDQKIEETPIL